MRVNPVRLIAATVGVKGMLSGIHRGFLYPYRYLPGLLEHSCSYLFKAKQKSCALKRDLCTLRA